MNIENHVTSLKKDIAETERNLERMRAALQALAPLAVKPPAKKKKPAVAKKPAPKKPIKVVTKAKKPKKPQARKEPEPAVLDAVLDAVPVGAVEGALRVGEIFGNALFRGLTVKRWKFEDALTHLVERGTVLKVGNTSTSRYYRPEAVAAPQGADTPPLASEIERVTDFTANEPAVYGPPQ